MSPTQRLEIRPYEPPHLEAVVALWIRCDLLRPWNDPERDIELCRRTPSSEVFVGMTAARGAPELTATVMTGSDGHRGWLYYLAVAPDQRRAGIGRRMVAHAEDWLAEQGIAKVELMIREENDAVRTFYERLGYEVEPRTVMSRWLRDR